VSKPQLVQRLTMAGWICLVALSAGNKAKGEQNAVTARVEIAKKPAAKPEKAPRGPVDASNVVVWLTPLDHNGSETSPAETGRKRMQLVQKNKSFQPHLLVVPVGSVVDFPNRDPFFHNVFSWFDGKSFDLGLYEAGASKSVRFDRAGVSFLFCNIHPEMSAVVVALDTPFYGVSDRAGNVMIGNVPDGKYEMHVWYERSLAEELKGLARTVTISPATRELGTIGIPENPSFSLTHKNKYGQDYAPPPSPGYAHPEQDR
jgi:plastocyanin